MTASTSHSRWRWPAAAALSATAAIHADLVPAHLHEAPYAGVLFIALAAGALTTAIALLATGHRLAWLAAGALCGSALVAYALSRSLGLPSMSDDIGHWLDPLGVGAVVSEMLVVALAGAVLAGQPRMVSSTGPVGVPARSPSP